MLDIMWNITQHCCNEHKYSCSIKEIVIDCSYLKERVPIMLDLEMLHFSSRQNQPVVSQVYNPIHDIQYIIHNINNSIKPVSDLRILLGALHNH